MSELEIIRPRRRGWLARLGQSVRSFTLGPYNTKDPALAHLFGNGREASAGVFVSPEAAFAVSAFHAAVTTIAWDVASLPLVLFRRLDGGGKARYAGHGLYKLLHDSPNPQQTSFEFRAALLMNALAGGNGFAEIERDASGRPVSLWHIDPWRVTVRLTKDEMLYDIHQPSGGMITLQSHDVIHIKGPSLDGVVGADTVRVAREALGLAIASERFGSSFFANGAQLGGILSMATGLTIEARENLRKAIAAQHQGSQRAYRWFLAPEGSTFTEVGTNPRDSQLTELREHQIGEIARFFRMPVAMIGDLRRSTWSNFEQQQLQYFTQCVRVWCVNIEQVFTQKLVSSLERNTQFIEHVTDGFLRADVEKRGAFYQQMTANGIMTINECRERENLPPIPGGDVAHVPLNTAPLPAAPAAPAPPSSGRQAALLAAHREVLLDAVKRMVARQVDRARRAQGTPVKLRAWCESYLGDAVQVEGTAKMLEPGVRAWLVCIESDVDPSDAAGALAQTQSDELKTALLRVADLERGELYEEEVTRLLQRWEQTGAETFVDRVLRSDFAKDGRLTVSAPVPRRLSTASPTATPTGNRLEWLSKWHKTQLAK